MNLAPIEVIYVSDTWKEIIEKIERILFLYSSSIVLNFNSINSDDNFFGVLRKYYDILKKEISINNKEIKKCIKIKNDALLTTLENKAEILAKENNNIPEIYRIREDLYSFFDSPVSIWEVLFLKKCRCDDSKIRILSVNELNEIKEKNGITFKPVSFFEERQLFIRHPFIPNTFIDVNTTESEIFIEKINLLSRIVQLLGATEIAGEAIFINEEERFVNRKGNVSYHSISFGAEEKKELSDYYKEHYKQTDTFPPVANNIEKWKQAKEIAVKYGLDKDKVIEALIIQRHPDNNPIKSRELTFDMTCEINRSFDLAFELIAHNISIKTIYKKIIKAKKSINYNLRVIF